MATARLLQRAASSGAGAQAIPIPAGEPGSTACSRGRAERRDARLRDRAAARRGLAGWSRPSNSTGGAPGRSHGDDPAPGFDHCKYGDLVLELPHAGAGPSSVSERGSASPFFVRVSAGPNAQHRGSHGATLCHPDQWDFESRVAMIFLHTLVDRNSRMNLEAKVGLVADAERSPSRTVNPSIPRIGGMRAMVTVMDGRFVFECRKQGRQYVLRTRRSFRIDSIESRAPHGASPFPRIVPALRLSTP
jgi:hypothetical protein